MNRVAGGGAIADFLDRIKSRSFTSYPADVAIRLMVQLERTLRYLREDHLPAHQRVHYPGPIIRASAVRIQVTDGISVHMSFHDIPSVWVNASQAESFTVVNLAP